MGLKNSSTSHSKKLTGVILLNLAFIVIGIAGLATGTMAWFASNVSAEVEVGSFSIVAPPGVEYSLFYLDYFTPDPLVPATTKDGNYDNVISRYAGYETSYVNATFAKIEYDSSGNVTTDPNPTVISDLWPNHKLTFAVITSSSISKLQLSEWTEALAETVGHAKVTEGTSSDAYVYLSWAIDIYGRAFSVEHSNSGDADADDLADVATGYALYHEAIATEGRDDRFNYSQASPAPNPHTAITVVGHDDPIEYYTSSSEGTTLTSTYNTVPSNASGYRTIVYFTIEFSNDSSTFYTETTTSGDDVYYSKDTSGNSNCYEKLRLTSLVFKIV